MVIGYFWFLAIDNTLRVKLQVEMVKMVQVSNVIEDLDQFDYEIIFQINKWKKLVKVLKFFLVLNFFIFNSYS
jgi:hypothetical protein